MAGRKADDRKVLTLDDLQQVAQVLKSNGTDGELVMSFRDIAPEDINIEEPVFIVFDGLPNGLKNSALQRSATLTTNN